MPKKKKTPTEEFEQIADRISKHITLPPGVFTMADLIKEIDKQYPLTGKGVTPHPQDHDIYQAVGEIMRKDTIQSNLSDFIKDEIPPEEYITPDQEADLLEAARGAYTKELQKEIFKRLEEESHETVSPILDEQTKADKVDIDSATEQYLRGPRIPEYYTVQEESKLTMKLAKDTQRASTVGIYRKEGVFKDVLEAFREPRSSRDVGEILQEKGIRTDKALSTVARDVRRFNLRKKGYTEQVIVKGVMKQRLTLKGEKMLGESKW